MKRRVSEKLHTRLWWALVDHADDLPVIFSSRAQARDNRTPTERVVQVRISVAPRHRTRRAR